MDGQTDIIAISVSRISTLTRDKNRNFRLMSRCMSEIAQDRAKSWSNVKLGVGPDSLPPMLVPGLFSPLATSMAR